MNNLTFSAWIRDWCVRMLMFGGLQPKLESKASKLEVSTE